MAAVQQDHTGGQEPNATSTPQRRRNTNAILAVLAVLIVLAIVAMVVGSRKPGTGMGGSISNESTVSGPPPSSAP